MKICRACLAASETEPLIPFDDTFLIYYNSLTNLNITLDDSLPKYCCQRCADAVNFFVQFRKKCTESENTLRAAIEKTKLDKVATQPIINEQGTNDIKPDIIKTEDHCDRVEEEEEEECSEELFNYVEDDGCNVKEEELGSETNKSNITEKEFGTTKFVKKEQKTRKGRSKVKSTKVIDKIQKVADKRKSKYNKNKKALLSESTEASESASLLCGICTKKDFDEKTLKTHLENHKKSKQCELCEEKVWSWPQLFGHRLQHLPKPQQKCHLCGQGYKSSAYLEFHYLNLHNDGQEKVIKCNKCWRTCATPYKLSKHLRVVHSDKKYTCDYCSRRFREKNILQRHILTHREQKTFKCDLCPYASKQATALNTHKLHRHNPTKVICKQCSRPFLNQEKMDLHRCGSRSIICPVCGKNVTRNQRLLKHMESHKTVGKYKCDRCPAVYKSSQALKTHINQHDGVRDKKCEFCPATFFSSSVLVKHRRIHTGEKPYVCEVCSKSFTMNYNLKVHMQIHGEFIINKKNKMDLSSSELK